MGKATGRPPVTRARVLGYVAKHWPCAVRQICRATDAERSYVKRILKQANIDTTGLLPPRNDQNRAVDGSPMNGLAYDSYLVGGTAKGATSDELEQRQAIRQMCRYIADDAKVARHHAVPLEKVQRIRAGMAQAKVKGLGVAKPQNGPVRSQNATGADVANPFSAEAKFEAMIAMGSALLRDALLAAIGERQRMVG